MADHKEPSRDCVQTPDTRTRSGRISKPPVRYEPIEQVEDDYTIDDYDSEESSEVSSEVSYDSSEEDVEDDADEEGNLDGFVVPDKSESDSDDSSDDGKPAVPDKRRAVPVKKRPARK